MKKLLKSTPLSILLLFLTGCATIIHGTRQNVSISSSPSSANIWVDQSYAGQTPLCVDLKRNQSHCIRIELKGYEPCEVTCNRQISGWLFGNLIFGGLPGLCIDAVSGAIFKLTPDQVNANLQRSDINVSTDKNLSYISIVMKADPSWQKIGQLKKADN